MKNQSLSKGGDKFTVRLGLDFLSSEVLPPHWCPTYNISMSLFNKVRRLLGGRPVGAQYKESIDNTEKKKKPSGRPVGAQYRKKKGDSHKKDRMTIRLDAQIKLDIKEFAIKHDTNVSELAEYSFSTLLYGKKTADTRKKLAKIIEMNE